MSQQSRLSQMKEWLRMGFEPTTTGITSTLRNR